MRGVHFFFEASLFMVSGSSPHARGPHSGQGIVGQLHGIIPACAGSTCAEAVGKVGS